MPLLVAKQGTPEWHAAHIGRITSSTAAACLGLGKGKSAKKAWRIILGHEVEDVNGFMVYGMANEANAVSEYEVETGRLVIPTGLWVSSVYPWLGASPDGLVGADGCLECKCPGELPGAIPLHYRIQMLVQMIVTERRWCDFYCWTPNGTFLKRCYLAGQEGLVRRLGAFYRDYVVTKIEPPRKKAKRRQAALAKVRG